LLLFCRKGRVRHFEIIRIDFSHVAHLVLRGDAGQRRSDEGLFAAAIDDNSADAGGEIRGEEKRGGWRFGRGPSIALRDFYRLLRGSLPERPPLIEE
jgi:hypothetical protein